MGNLMKKQVHLSVYAKMAPRLSHKEEEEGEVEEEEGAKGEEDLETIMVLLAEMAEIAEVEEDSVDEVASVVAVEVIDDIKKVVDLEDSEEEEGSADKRIETETTTIILQNYQETLQNEIHYQYFFQFHFYNMIFHISTEQQNYRILLHWL